MCARVLAVAALLGVFGGATTAARAAGEVQVVTLRGMIHPVSASYLEDAIDSADRTQAAALVIVMDTPGGFVESTKEIAQKILAARTPVIGFVTPAGARAASGGFFLLMACDLAVMSPATNTGAAHPVTGSGEDHEEDIGMQKAESDLSAFMRSMAENRGRNVKLAESAVRESVSWTEKEALEGKLIEIVALDLDDLKKQAEGRTIRRMNGAEAKLDLSGAVVPSRAMTTIERVQDFLLTPAIAAGLLGLGLLGLYIELTHPGLILPGAVGVTCLALFGYAAHILPVNIIGLLLIGLSIALFVLELKFTSHGLLGLGGTVSLVAGSLMLFNGPIPEMRLPAMLVLPTSLALAGGMLFVMRFVVRAQRAVVATGREGLVGEIGVASTDLALDGKIFVHGEYWNARAIAPVLRGARVRVRAVDDMRLVVEPEGSGA